MADLAALGEVISTDVLIVGGGFGGIIAAIKAKEEKEHPVDVLIVEKATTGWAGKAPHIGGSLTFVAPDDDADRFVEYQVKSMGGYLNDQDLLYRYAHDSYGAVRQLMEWGARFARHPDGTLEIRRHPVGPWSQTDIDIDCQLPLWAKARKLGVKILNKIQVVDLLKQGDRVAGAVGFSVLDGRFYIFKAKATILANGSCDYRVERLWSSACGDGIAAAFRAGAEMRNAEFGNFYEKRRKDLDGAARGGGQEFLINALGEHISQRYVPDPQPDISMDAILGIEKELMEGRGPVFMDVSKMQRRVRNIPKLNAIKQRQADKAAKYGFPLSERPEVMPAFLGELSCIKVDHDMKTSLAGLWAIGDTSYSGSGQPGAVPAPPGRTGGSGLMNAALGAFMAGPYAARFVSEVGEPEIRYDEVRRLKEEIFSPMQRSTGLEPYDAIYSVQDVVSPVKYNLRRSKERLEEALSRIKEIHGRLPELIAKDAHYLGKCHEAKCFAVCAELTFRAALMRTESRGWHYREDYPERDDKNWLKWIIVKQEAGKMTLSTEPVPIHKYKFKP